MSRIPDISVIIVSWNVRELLASCLHSLEETKDDIVLEIFVIDNASSDGSADMVERIFPDIHLERLPENIGFGRGNNVALHKARAPLVLLLNPDTIVLPGALKALKNFLATDSQIAVVGPTILTPRKSIDPSCRRFPTMPAALHQFTFAKYFLFMGISFQRYMMRDFDHRSIRDVDQIMGACMLIRRDVIDHVGMFDEQFHMFYEEVDLCYRIKKAGYRLVFYPDASIIHYSDQSTGQIWDQMLFEKITSLFIYFGKIHSSLTLSIYKSFFKILFLLKMGKDYLQTRIKVFHYQWIPTGSRTRERSEIYFRRAEQLKSFIQNYTRKILEL